MKNSVIIPCIILVAVGIAVLQHRSLDSLQKEHTALSRAVSSGTTSSGRAPATVAVLPPLHRVDSRTGSRPSSPDASSATVATPDARLAEIQDLMVSLLGRIAVARAGKGPAPDEEAAIKADKMKLTAAFSALEVPAFLALVERLKNSPDAPEILRTQPAVVSMEIMQRDNPATAVGALLLMPDYPDRERAFVSAFAKWSTVAPADLIEWFDRESPNANPLLEAPGILRQVIIAQAAVDPARALSRALSDEAAAHPADLKNLGGSVALLQTGEKDSSVFFHALRAQDARQPGSPVLAGIREDYVGQLSRDMLGWPGEEAISVIDAEFTPAEKSDLRKYLSSRGDLDEPGRWANWLAGSRLPEDDNHPLGPFVTMWSVTDPAAAGEWLETFPAGEFKDRLVSRFVNHVSQQDPARAMKAAMTMGQGDLRTRTLSGIHETWTRSDPAAAAAAFLEQHRLSK